MIYAFTLVFVLSGESMKEINLDDIIAMAQTIYGEARNQPYDGMVMVGRVIYNRAMIKDTSIWEEAHKHKQFSCWNKDDPNLFIIGRTRVVNLLTEMKAALDAFLDLSGKYEKITHYHAKGIKPYWTKGKKPALTIGDHVFYDNID